PYPVDEKVLQWVQGENREELIECLESKGKTVEDIAELERKLDRGQVLMSILSPERQVEILRQIVSDLALWTREDITSESAKTVSPEKAQWATVATAPPVVFDFEDSELLAIKIAELDELGVHYEVNGSSLKISGCRASFAFHKKPCQYKMKNKKGCRFCFLSAGNMHVKVTSAQQIAALNDGLLKVKKAGGRMTTFEILPDGSLLNAKEVSAKVPIAMMERLSEEETLHRVSIETRPEYCNPLRVKELLGKLRKDQKLHIYFGMESTDEFVGSIINNKGFGFEEFKTAVRNLVAVLDPDELERLELASYNMVKPAYITDREALDLSIKAAQDINEFSQEVGIKIDVKYEPAVASEGTIQHYMFTQRDSETGERRYRPPSYFTIAELLAQLIEKDLAHLAKFGQRDDIDNYKTVAMVSQLGAPNLFSQFDFMVYNAVQRFNTTRDPRQFILDMRIAVQYSDEFKEWEDKLCGASGASALSRLLDKELCEGISDEEQGVEDFQKEVWEIADDIEYSKNFSDRIRLNGKLEIPVILEEISKKFTDKRIDLFKLDEFVLIDDDPHGVGLLSDSVSDAHGDFDGDGKNTSVQFEVILMNESGYPQSLWVKIPLIPVELPDRPSFIYG
ncbi:hypothetical protein HON58_00150, partial [Candidatus Peregrinibacteria bacterium]|nr:hypothetical protein [Candidatus Peregrinibacteria bacterium]